MFHTNGNWKRTGIATLLSDQIDFKSKTIKTPRRSFHNDK
jgi:hypothetical protein